MAFITDQEKQSLVDRYFDIEWCDDVSDLRCVRCHRVAINHFMSSCQHIFCKTCSKFYNDEQQQLKCPQCQETITQPEHQDLNVEVKIYELKMFCPNKKFGCTYSDQLCKLPSHLMTCLCTREAAFPLQSPLTMADVDNQSTNLNDTVGELREVRVNTLERKTEDINGEIVASTSEDNNIEGKEADMQVASENYTREFESMKLQLLESMNQTIQQNELHHQQTMAQISLNMEEMKTKMASMTQEIETLQKELTSCQNQPVTPLRPGFYNGTIEFVKNNILNDVCTFESGEFNIPGYKYDIKARIVFDRGLIMIGIQFEYGRKVNEFFNNDGFGAVKYIVRDQTNTGQQKDIICENYLKFNDGSGDQGWLFKNFLPDEVLDPPYLVDDCLKITIILEPEVIDRSFVSDNGILEWRVNNYRERLEERLYSHIFSPSFYTSPTGYRVRVEIEILDAQSMKVTPHFLTGEHDGRLPLNFPRKTTLTLINQTDPSRNLVISEQCEDLEQDAMKLSTAISMEEDGFIKDDSFELKVAIEPVASE